MNTIVKSIKAKGRERVAEELVAATLGEEKLKDMIPAMNRGVEIMMQISSSLFSEDALNAAGFKTSLARVNANGLPINMEEMGPMWISISLNDVAEALGMIKKQGAAR